MTRTTAYRPNILAMRRRSARALPDSRTSTRTRRFDKANTDTITVLVGKRAQPFDVPRPLLCSSSRFFQTVLDGQWLESRNSTITLAKAKSTMFAAYVHWLRTGNVDVPSRNRESKSGESAQDTLNNILRCFVLGDFLGDRHFCNKLTDKMLCLTKWAVALPSSRLIEKYWLRLGLSKSGMRRLLVHLLAVYGDGESAEQLPPDFVLQIAKVSMIESFMDVPDRWPERRGWCYYHEHIDEDRWCSRLECYAHCY